MAVVVMHGGHPSSLRDFVTTSYNIMWKRKLVKKNEKNENIPST